LHAPDFLHVVSHFFKHFSHLPVAALNDRYFEPGIIAFANEPNFCRRRPHSPAALFGDRNSSA
jgi:hypothetical protein